MLCRPVNGGKGPLIHEEMGDVWTSYSHGCLDRKDLTVFFYCPCLLVIMPQHLYCLTKGHYMTHIDRKSVV